MHHVNLREIDKSEFRVSPGNIRKTYPINETTLAVFTDNCELFINTNPDGKTVTYPGEDTCRNKNTRTLAIFDGFETASGKNNGNNQSRLYHLRCYADEEDYDRECEVLNSQTLLKNGTLSEQAAPGGKPITRHLFYSDKYPLSVRILGKETGKETLEYFYVLYQTNSGVYVKKIIRSLKNNKALWRGDLRENIRLSTELADTIDLVAYKSVSQILLIGNFPSNNPSIKLYDASFSKFLGTKKLICRSPDNGITYKKITTSFIYNENIYALFNYDESALSHSALCVFDISDLENNDEDLLGEFHFGYSVLEHNDHLDSLAANDKFIAMLSTSGKLIYSKDQGSSFTEVELLPQSLTNGYMDIAGQHLLLSFDSTYYIYDFNAPRPTPSPKSLPTETNVVTDKLTKTHNTTLAVSSYPTIYVSEQTPLPQLTSSLVPFSLSSVPAFIIYSMGLAIILLLAAVVYLYCTKKGSDDSKDENLEITLSESSTRRTLLSSDTDSPQSTPSFPDDSYLQFPIPPVVLTSSEDQFASINRSLRRNRPKSHQDKFNTVRPSSIDLISAEIPSSRDSPPYQSQTLPTKRNRSYNGQTAPLISPITRRHRTESIVSQV